MPDVYEKTQDNKIKRIVTTETVHSVAELKAIEMNMVNQIAKTLEPMNIQLAIVRNILAEAEKRGLS